MEGRQIVENGLGRKRDKGKMGTRHVLQLDLSQQEEKKIPR